MSPLGDPAGEEVGREKTFLEGRGQTLLRRRGAALRRRIDWSVPREGAGGWGGDPGARRSPGAPSGWWGGPVGLQIPSGSQELRQDRPGGAMEGSPIPVLTVPTAPYEDQRPTGGGSFDV